MSDHSNSKFNSPGTGSVDPSWQRLTAAFSQRCEKVDPDEISRSVTSALTKASVIDHQLVWRDVRESLAALFVACFFGAIPSFLPLSTMSRIGAGILVLTAIQIAIRLWWARSSVINNQQTPLQVLRASRVLINRQIKMLRNISWWYLGPMAAGYLLFVWGSMPTGQAIGSSIFYYCLDRTLWWLNQRAVEKDLLPLRRELEQSIAWLESPIGSNAHPSTLQA